MTVFLVDRYGKAEFPLTTDDLTVLVERDSADLDLYADLSDLGREVEGVTHFNPGKKPRVRISEKLAGDVRRENRLRTTLTHEYGHVHFHAYLWDLEAASPGLFDRPRTDHPLHCKRDSILDAPETDWMEWQAGYVCGAILMPISRLRGVVREFFEGHETTGEVGPRSAEGRALIDVIASTFQVSEEAARVRLAKLGHLGLDGGRSLFS